MSKPYFFNFLEKGSLIIENKENEIIIQDIVKNIKDNNLNICFLSSGKCRSEIYIIEYLILNNYKINKLIFVDKIYSNKNIILNIELVIEMINNFFNINVEYSFHTDYDTLLLEEFNNYLNDYPNIKNIHNYKLDLIIGIHYQILIMGDNLEEVRKEKEKHSNNINELKERINYINFYYDDNNPLISTKILQYFNFNNNVEFKHSFL